MNLPKAVLLTLAFGLSSMAFAEDGADRVFTRVVDAQHTVAAKKSAQQVASTATQKEENAKACC
ncbi:co-regulatory protein PtrA N-terminal domain-containing protein [Pseudomonas sp. Marseille-Q5115]|uniref:co-regulatory protein PtrA N-terminal domain-containing protein n=1 Tax=Pseudomonas sp. Marseille-Q5115 TaxID=2866593 RepID=UPI001CE455E3|nr:co-regulatory protein PtrA N-terminal domain-containing protein [Pseudomonas sp. Marseille-Q5115]